MPMKRSILLLSLLVLSFNNSDLYSQEKPKRRRPPKITHRWGVSTAWLIQNAPFREFSTFQLDRIWYAQGIDTWDLGNSANGVAVGFSYDLTSRKGMMFRVQGFVETTGWISGVLDIGTGIRIPMPLKKSYFSIEAYFSINQTGGTLHRIGAPEASLPDSIDFYMGLFGFKSRIAFEFPVGKKFFLTPYLSYAVYPWYATSTKAKFYLNGFEKGSLIDSIQIGLEFGSKF